jgi:hypothetical protein
LAAGLVVCLLGLVGTLPAMRTSEAFAEPDCAAAATVYVAAPVSVAVGLLAGPGVSAHRRRAPRAITIRRP